MMLGNTVIGFVSVTNDPNNVDEYNKPSKVRTTTDVPGCHFRPLTTTEAIDLGDLVTDTAKATCPPVATVLAATAKDQLIVAGVTYKIVGTPRVFEDLAGRPFKVTVIAQRVDG